MTVEHDVTEPAGMAAEMVSDELVEAMVADASAGGVDLLGPDGVLAELTKRVLERALAEEMTDHLGYEPGDPMGHGTGNNRNGSSPKQVLTEIGAVDLGLIGIQRGVTVESRFPVGFPGVEQRSGSVVGEVAEPEGDSFDSFDQVVDRFGGSVRDAGMVPGDDLGVPAGEGTPEPVGFSRQ